MSFKREFYRNVPGQGEQGSQHWRGIHHAPHQKRGDPVKSIRFNPILFLDTSYFYWVQYLIPEVYG